MIDFPVFQYIACLIAIFFVIVFFKYIRIFSVRSFHAVKVFFQDARSKVFHFKRKIRKYSRSRKVKFSISQFFQGRYTSDGNSLWSIVYITKIIVRKKYVTIHTVRPGILIGVKGSTIEALKAFLKEHYGIEKVHIKESNPFK